MFYCPPINTQPTNTHTYTYIYTQPPPSPPLLPTLLSLALELPNALLTLRDLLPHTTHPATGLSTRLAAAVWVSIWAAFFLCQLFPAAYLFIMTLALIPSSASRPLLMVVGGGLACVGLVGRMKTLSARFQLDFSKKHVEHVLFGGGRKHD